MKFNSGEGQEHGKFRRERNLLVKRIGLIAEPFAAKLQPMSLAELKQNVLELPAEQKHEFLVWINHLTANYGDISDEALSQIAAEIWDADEKHAPPTHPAR
jgi:hypothetical protein